MSSDDIANPDEDGPASLPEKPLPPARPGHSDPPDLLPEAEVESAYGEPTERLLDLNTWTDAIDLAANIERVEREVDEAIEQEDDFHRRLRQELFPAISDPDRRGAPKGADVYEVTSAQLAHAQATSLFNGAVEACDGTSVTHDSLPLSITQIGVCLVSYLGGQGSWGQRLFRRDLRVRGGDPLREMLELLHRRNDRTVAERSGRRDQLSELGRRGIMSYAERAVLLRKGTKPWRMGHGHPTPYELITGSGSMELLRTSLDLLRELILDHRKFVFVPSRINDRVLTSIGYALRPREFAIVDRDEIRTRPIVENGNLRGEHRRRAIAFVDEVTNKVVAGVFRTGRHSPPQIFYAHEDFAQQAALIAMADSVLQPTRSFPTLIDLADSIAGRLFGAESFHSTIQNTYARRGDPLRYLNERDTRP